MQSLQRNLQYAWRGATRDYAEWLLSIVGGLPFGGYLLWTGHEVPLISRLHESPWLLDAIVLLTSIIIARGTIFFARLFWSPFYFWFEPNGGLWKSLQINLGARMWPVLLMVAGLGAFVLLFGAGAIWYVISASSSPTQLWSPSAVYEASHKLEVIDTAIPMIQNEFSSFITRGMRVSEQWAAHKDAPAHRLEYAVTLRAYASDVDDLRKRFYSLRRENQRYEDIYALLQPTFENQILSFANHLAGVAERSVDLSQDAISFLDKDAGAFEDSIRDSIKWRDTTTAALLSIRKEISEQTISLPTPYFSAPARSDTPAKH